MPKSFNHLLVAWFASVTGDGMRFAALPLLALTLSRSPAAVSAVAAATALPWLLIALPAGALVDRLDPAVVIAWANVGRALSAGLLVAAVLDRRADIPLLCAVGFLLTAGETFADSAGQSLLVRIVPPDRLESANARFVGSENIGLDLIGPLAAGGLFVVARWLPFAVAAMIFVITAFGMVALRGYRPAVVGDSEASGTPGVGGAAAVVSVGPTTVNRPGPAGPHLEGGAPHGEGDSPQPQDGGSQREGAASDRADGDGHRAGDGTCRPAPSAAAIDPEHSPGLSVRAGFRVIFADSQLRALVITVAIMSAAIAAAEGVLVVYSESVLRLPAAVYPTLLACYSVGLVLAAAAVSRWGGLLRPGAMMVGAVAVIGATLLVMGVFPHPIVAWCSFLAMGAAGGVWNVLSASRRQRRTPRSMIARVSSTFRAIAWGALPLGTALGGLIGQTSSVPTVFVAAGLVVLALGAAAGRFLMADDGAVPAAGGPSAVDRSGAAEPV